MQVEPTMLAEGIALMSTCMHVHMQVEPKMLAEGITYKTMGGGKLSTYKSPLEPPRATIARNSLIMHIYSLVFDWCVTVINDYISVYNAAYATGILDIFGFENFGVNSFPQVMHA